CHRFLPDDLQKRLVDEVGRCGLNRSLLPDGTVCSDVHALDLGDIICDIYAAEPGDGWHCAHADDPGDTAEWRDYLRQKGIVHLEEIQDGEVWFTLPVGQRLP